MQPVQRGGGVQQSHAHLVAVVMETLLPLETSSHLAFPTGMSCAVAQNNWIISHVTFVYIRSHWLKVMWLDKCYHNWTHYPNVYTNAYIHSVCFVLYSVHMCVYCLATIPLLLHALIRHVRLMSVNNPSHCLLSCTAQHLWGNWHWSRLDLPSRRGLIERKKTFIEQSLIVNIVSYIVYNYASVVFVGNIVLYND